MLCLLRCDSDKNYLMVRRCGELGFRSVMVLHVDFVTANAIMVENEDGAMRRCCIMRLFRKAYAGWPILEADPVDECIASLVDQIRQAAKAIKAAESSVIRHRRSARV